LKQSSAVHIQSLVSADGILPDFCWLTSAFSYKFSFGSGRTVGQFPNCHKALPVVDYAVGELFVQLAVRLRNLLHDKNKLTTKKRINEKFIRKRKQRIDLKKNHFSSFCLFILCILPLVWI
jgi:hypothetical protein